MAGSLANYAENLILNWLLSAAGATRPTLWYVALFSDTAGTATDQPVTELVAGTSPGYVRQQITSWTISGTTPTQAVNATVATFTATGAWLTANYFGIYDAATVGNLLTWGSITPKTLANTDQLQFAASAITITLD